MQEKPPSGLDPPCFSIRKVSDWQGLHFSPLQWSQIQCEWLEKHLIEHNESLIGHPGPYRNIIEIVCDYLDKKKGARGSQHPNKSSEFSLWRSQKYSWRLFEEITWNFVQKRSGCAVLTQLSILTTSKFPMLNIPIFICHVSTNYYQLKTRIQKQ